MRLKPRRRSLIFSGIYAFICPASKECYVGESGHLLERKTAHLSTLRRRAHTNKGLQRVFDRYGEENLQWVVLEFCSWPRSFAEKREVYWMKAMSRQYALLNERHDNKPISFFLS